MSGRNKKVKVWLRIRPTAKIANDMLYIHPDGKSVNIHRPDERKKAFGVNNELSDWCFKFDGVFDNAKQEQVYNTVASPLVSAALQGYNGTIMAYGQTGAGKTFTMAGATEHFKHRGIIPRALSQLYKLIDEQLDSSIQIRISYLEIYNETMFDLLSTMPESMNEQNQLKPLTIVEDDGNIQVKGLNCFPAQNEEEALNLLFEGETNRAIAAHTLNAHSSRSHCIFTVYVESRSRVHSGAQYVVSKLHFVDLAGSERLGKTESSGYIQQEALYINKSLCFLEQTIIALADRRRDFIPFRQSKLTHFLKDSIGGNSHTILIANVWGEPAQMNETISTLRFATRMMCVTSLPVKNEKLDPMMQIKKLEMEVSALKQELTMHDILTNRTQMNYDVLSEQQLYDIKQLVQEYLDGQVEEMEILNVRQLKAVLEALKEQCLSSVKATEQRLRENYHLVDKVTGQSPSGHKFISDSTNVTPTEKPLVRTMSIPQIQSGKGKRRDSKRRAKEKAGGVSPAGPAKTDAVMRASQTSIKKEELTDEVSVGPRESLKQMTGSGVMGQQPLVPSTTVPTRPSTPPNRKDAFEDYKKEAGHDIHSILMDNKGVLSEKKRLYADLARQINCTKQEMDLCLGRLNKLKAHRLSQGNFLNDNGEEIITEDEYLELQRLRDLKTVYRRDFDELRTIKAEVQYCQKLVDQCRQRLLQTFDTWYTESFLAQPAGTELQMTTAQTQDLPDVQPVNIEDAQEKFDKILNQLNHENPEASAFYSAKMKSKHRKALSPRRHIGTPIRALRNPPPAMLQVYH